MTLSSRVEMEFASLEMQLREARAEIERLRAALVQAAFLEGIRRQKGWAQSDARAALKEPKP